MYQNGKRNNIYTLGDFENKTPTHMAATHAISNLSDVFKIEFPWHWTKTFISPDSAWYIESLQIFKYKKIALEKKLWRFRLPEINLNIERVSLIKEAVHGRPVLYFWTFLDPYYVGYMRHILHSRGNSDISDKSSKINFKSWKFPGPFSQ